MSADPYVVRSQRNKDRRPAPTVSAAITNPPKTGDTSLEAGDTFDYGAQSRLRMVRPQHYLGYVSTSAIIFNRMVGTGIFVAPPVVLAIVGSKGLSLILWLVGGIVTWAGLMVYLEYGFLFPLTGGELHYIDFVWLRPKMLMTYMYSIMFILLSGSQSNALVFGSGIIQASTPLGTNIDFRLQKFLAIVLVGVVCQMQSVSRMNYIRFSNMFAIYKVTLLAVLTILGWCALGSYRTSAASASNAPYGTVNFYESFKDINTTPYGIALALLDIMRVYGGYENANFVLEEVRRPPMDETRVFRRSAILTVALISFFYLMVNVALFAACTTEELVGASDVLSIFFTKVFGASTQTRIASGILLALSSAGNVMATTFAAVRVKQEIARLGILPWPAFWAKSTRMNTPGPALLLHWISSTIVIAAVPLGSANGYLIFSTLYNYARTIVAVMLGLALLFATRLDSFKVNGTRWGDSKTKFAKILTYGQALIFIVFNLFVFVVSWFPAGLQSTLHTTTQVVPSFIGPLVSMCCYVAGAVLWLWDLHIAPALGYEVEVLQERREGLNVHMTFNRRITRLSRKLVKALHLEPLFQKSKKTESSGEDVTR